MMCNCTKYVSFNLVCISSYNRPSSNLSSDHLMLQHLAWAPSAHRADAQCNSDLVGSPPWQAVCSRPLTLKLNANQPCSGADKRICSDWAPFKHVFIQQHVFIVVLVGMCAPQAKASHWCREV
jgi:hypothetical protein